MTWNIFQDLVEDFSHSEIYKQLLNENLLRELTMNYSDLDILKYLHIILLSVFKNHIQRTDDQIEDDLITDDDLKLIKLKMIKLKKIQLKRMRFTLNLFELNMFKLKMIKLKIIKLKLIKLKIPKLKMIEGHNEYKCEYCGKSYSKARSLKTHIHTVHEGHKDNKCEDYGK